MRGGEDKVVEGESPLTGEEKEYDLYDPRKTGWTPISGEDFDPSVTAQINAARSRGNSDVADFLLKIEQARVDRVANLR